MASEEQDDGAVALTLPPDLRDWIDERAEREGADRETVCRRLLGAVRAAESDEAIDPPARGEVEDLRARIDAQRDEFVEHVEDVCDRVIQVKREADAKAAADHDHPALAADIESIRDDLASLESDLDGLEDAFTGLEARLEAGFDNYEEILDYLVAETDDLGERASVLANAVLDLRDRRRSLAARERRHAETEELKLAVNRMGIRTATCEDCGASVDLGLLTRPECPRCASGFADVAAKSSLFGSPRLVTGQPPALEGRDADAFETDDPDGVFDAVASEAGDAEGEGGDENARGDASANERANDGEAPDSSADADEVPR